MKQIIELYSNGLSIRAISAKLGISTYFVSKELKNISKRKPWDRSRNHDLIKYKDKSHRDNLIIDLYESGNGSYVISKKLNISKSTVLRVLKNNKINRNGKSLNLNINYNDVKKLYESGKTLEEIAHIFNTTETTISRNLKCDRISRSDRLSIITKDHQKQIIDLYKNEMLSIYDLSDKFGYHSEVIRRFLNKKNLIRDVKERRKLAAIKLSNRKCFISKPHKIVEKVLSNLQVDFEREYPIDEWSYDIYIKSKNMLIEIQGEYWHSFKDRVNRDKIKRKFAINNGYDIKYVWESYTKNETYLENTIKYWLGIGNIINYEFRDLTIKIDDKNEANCLIEYHYLGKFGNNGMLITGFIDEIPVITAMFSPPTRQEIAKKQNVKFGEILELSRMSANPLYQKKNLVSYFLSKAIKIIRNTRKDIKKLVSFADCTHGHNGSCYKAAGWVYDGSTRPNYWYQKDRNIIHKKKIWDLAKKAGISEKEYADLHEYKKITGDAKNRFVKLLRK